MKILLYCHAHSCISFIKRRAFWVINRIKKEVWIIPCTGSPSNRNEYWLPDFPTHARIPQRLLANRPGSSSSTFHEIIKLLVPGSRNNALKYDIKSHLQTANGPVSPIRRFPSRQPFIQARNEVVVTLPRVPPLPQAPVINNNKAQARKYPNISQFHLTTPY